MSSCLHEVYRNIPLTFLRILRHITKHFPKNILNFKNLDYSITVQIIIQKKIALCAKITARISHFAVEGKGEG